MAYLGNKEINLKMITSNMADQYFGTREGECTKEIIYKSQIPLNGPAFLRWGIKSSGEQGWRSGESTRLSPMWPGFNPRTRCHLWVEFVVGSRSCSEGFSLGSPVVLSPQKQHFLLQFDPESEESKCHPR